MRAMDGMQAAWHMQPEDLKESLLSKAVSNFSSSLSSIFREPISPFCSVLGWKWVLGWG